MGENNQGDMSVNSVSAEKHIIIAIWDSPPQQGDHNRKNTEISSTLLVMQL